MDEIYHAINVPFHATVQRENSLLTEKTSHERAADGQLGGGEEGQVGQWVGQKEMNVRRDEMNSFKKLGIVFVFLFF